MTRFAEIDLAGRVMNIAVGRLEALSTLRGEWIACDRSVARGDLYNRNSGSFEKGAG